MEAIKKCTSWLGSLSTEEQKMVGTWLGEICSCSSNCSARLWLYQPFFAPLYTCVYSLASKNGSGSGLNSVWDSYLQHSDTYVAKIKNVKIYV